MTSAWTRPSSAAGTALPASAARTTPSVTFPPRIPSRPSPRSARARDTGLSGEEQNNPEPAGAVPLRAGVERTHAEPRPPRLGDVFRRPDLVGVAADVDLTHRAGEIGALLQCPHRQIAVQVQRVGGRIGPGLL